MNFKKEKKQYEEDCKTHEKPWELWQYTLARINILHWYDLHEPPEWAPNCKYRRKPNVFIPKYFSGINWRDAEYLIGKTIECSNDPDTGWKVGKLRGIVPMREHFDMDMNGGDDFYIYIRTREEITPNNKGVKHD